MMYHFFFNLHLPDRTHFLHIIFSCRAMKIWCTKITQTMNSGLTSNSKLFLWPSKHRFFLDGVHFTLRAMLHYSVCSLIKYLTLGIPYCWIILPCCKPLSKHASTLLRDRLAVIDIHAAGTSTWRPRSRIRVRFVCHFCNDRRAPLQHFWWGNAHFRTVWHSVVRHAVRCTRKVVFSE